MEAQLEAGVGGNQVHQGAGEGLPGLGVTLKVELTDANGVGVTQTLNRFYGIH